LIFESPENADHFFLQMENTVRQMAHIMAKTSDTYAAKSKDVVAMLNEHDFAVVPQFNWNILNQ